MKVSLPELEAVDAVARHGGFRAAARALGQSPSALSHAVAAVEERLAVRLFNRTTRSVSLTAAGEQFLAQVGPALSAIGSAVDDLGLRASEPAGTLRLNMAPGAARLILEPIILPYARRHPKVAVEIATESAMTDIIGAGFDAGVRLAETVPPDMIGVPIFPRLRMIVVGSPQYLESATLPASPEDLSQHRCINMRMSSGRIYRWEFERRGESVVRGVQGNLIFDATDLILAAALDGAGLAYVEERNAAPHIASGRLIQLLGDWTPPYPGLSLYYAGRRHLPLNLRALVDLIQDFNRLGNIPVLSCA